MGHSRQVTFCQKHTHLVLRCKNGLYLNYLAWVQTNSLEAKLKTRYVVSMLVTKMALFWGLITNDLPPFPFASKRPKVRDVRELKSTTNLPLKSENVSLIAFSYYNFKKSGGSTNSVHAEPLIHVHAHLIQR